MVFALAFNVVRFLEFSALNVRWDTQRLRLDRLGAARPAHHARAHRLPGYRPCSTALMFCRPDGRAPVRRRLRERDVLVLRRAVVAADLCPHLLCATDRLTPAAAARRAVGRRARRPARVGGAARDQLRPVVRRVRAATDVDAAPGRGVALALVAGARRSTWRRGAARAQLRARARGVHRSGRDRDSRARFMAIGGLALCAWFALVILATEIPVLVLKPCTPC